MKLKELMPDRYDTPEIADYLDAVQKELDRLETAYDRMTDDLFIDTAQEWLSLWEAAYGITTDATKDAAFRRAKVKAKMQGAGTTTVELIRQTAAPYSEELPEVIEDNPAYTFSIYLYSSMGSEPENLPDLRAVLDEIKPAHLYYEIYMLADIGSWGQFFGGVVEVSDVYEF